MAQNLFEKYGIKEVADVTLSRIDKEDVTYESQRKISISSILKSALTKEMVYPIDEDGKGSEDGYEAYVFKDADVLTHYNYDCDDEINIKGKAYYLKEIKGNGSDYMEKYNKLDYGDPVDKSASTTIIKDIKNNGKNGGLFSPKDGTVVIKYIYDKDSNRDLTNKINGLLASGYKLTKESLEVDPRILWQGTTNNAITAGDVELYEYRAELASESYAADLDEKRLEGFKGSLKVNFFPGSGSGGKKHQLSGYISFAAPYNASGEELRDAIKVQQQSIYNSLGVILRFKQPVRYGEWSKRAEEKEEESSIVKQKEYKKFEFTFTAKLTSEADSKTGMFGQEKWMADQDTDTHKKMDKDKDLGTHEFSYPEQVCMLFSKNQNLITKAGTRYFFQDADRMFADFEFNDEFSNTPNSTERVVVVGLSGKTSENLYDIEEFDETIKNMKDTIDSKAYTIGYSDYAELVVEDEMGYYIPQQLGYELDRANETLTFFSQIQEEAAEEAPAEESAVTTQTYEQYANSKRGLDIGIYSAVNTWGDERHYSINDAIDALKQKKQILDTTGDMVESGFTRIFGGYKVRGKSLESDLPIDDDGRGAMYEDYTINGTEIKDATGSKLSSSYTLQGVLDALSVAQFDHTGQLRLTSTAEIESNRAIYIDTNKNLISNRADIYLLKNVNNRVINSDKSGIFEFYDKKGNKLYYQDKVFKGTPYLALVVIGSMGLVFVVNRHSNKKFEQNAWMINDNGYITDKQGERLVKNGLIHTVTVTDCNESFDATCTVNSIKIRRITKNVTHYTPVLYLDSLKVSTLEQATETTSAQGGRGNAKLITWDYGKEITLSIEDALYNPASMSAIWAGEDGDLKNGVQDAKTIDRFEKITAKRNFIVPPGNYKGTPVEGDNTAQAVYYDPKTMEPFQDGTPIARGDVIYKFTRSIAYDGESIGNIIEISAEKFPGTYRVMGETNVRNKATGKDQRFQFIIPEAKMTASDASITLEADGDPSVFSFSMDVLRPENGIMMEFVQFDVEENTEENDGSTKIKDTENLNLLDEAEMYQVSGNDDEEEFIGATEY